MRQKARLCQHNASHGGQVLAGGSKAQLAQLCSRFRPAELWRVAQREQRLCAAGRLRDDIPFRVRSVLDADGSTSLIYVRSEAASS